MAKIYAKMTAKELKNEKARLWRQKNRDKVAAAAKRAHAKKMKELKKSPKKLAEYRAERAAYAREWRKKNIEHNREYQRNYQREYSKEEKLTGLDRNQIWRESNPEKYEQQLERNNEIYHQKMKLLNDFRDGKCCAFCGNPKNLSVAAVDQQSIKTLFARADHYATIVSIVRSTDISKMNLQTVQKFFSGALNLKCVCSKCLKNVEATK